MQQAESTKRQNVYMAIFIIVTNLNILIKGIFNE